MFTVPAARVAVWGATVAAMAVLGDTLAFVLGTSACGVLREGSPAMVVGLVCSADENRSCSHPQPALYCLLQSTPDRQHHGYERHCD